MICVYKWVFQIISLLPNCSEKVPRSLVFDSMIIERAANANFRPSQWCAGLIAHRVLRTSLFVRYVDHVETFQRLSRRIVKVWRKNSKTLYVLDVPLISMVTEFWHIRLVTKRQASSYQTFSAFLCEMDFDEQQEPFYIPHWVAIKHITAYALHMDHVSGPPN